MINEAPMTPGARRAKAAQTKQVYTTAKGGQTLQNLRLRQKGSQDAAARAKRTMSTAANPVAIDTGPVRTPVVPLSAPRIISRKPKPIKKVKPKVNTLDTPVTTEQIGTPGARNYAKIMRARRDAQRKAAAQNTNQPVGGQSQSTTSTTSTTGVKKSVPVLNRKAFVSKSADDLKKRIDQKKAAMTGPGTVATLKQKQQDRRTDAAKAAKAAADKAKKDQDDADKEAKRRAKDAADARSERRKRNLKRAVVGTGLAGAAASFALASHTEYDKPSIKERKKMKNFHSLREAKMVTGNETGMMFKVSIEGLPDMIMVGRSPSGIKGQLRKIVKQPSMIQSVERMPKSKVKMMYRDIVAGREEEE